MPGDIPFFDDALEDETTPELDGGDDEPETECPEPEGDEDEDAYGDEELEELHFSVEHLEKKIQDRHFVLLPSGRAVVCELVLKNGFVLLGGSAPFGPAPFDEMKARRRSYDCALKKLSEAEGYHLYEDSYTETNL